MGKKKDGEDPVVVAGGRRTVRCRHPPATAALGGGVRGELCVRPAPSPLLLLVVLAGALAGGGEAALLKAHFYRPSCPAAEAVVRDIVVARVAADPAALPARLLRLFFHDCFVRGCDASVLVDSMAGNTAEKDAGPNGSLGGLDVIDTAKAVLEAVCPGVVSCADIVALAARDAISFQFGRDLWDVQLGRRDGVVSSASEALSNIPSPSDNFTTLEAKFASKGLDVKDLVILSVRARVVSMHAAIDGAHARMSVDVGQRPEPSVVQ
ncbi:Peroxidase 3 [Triticum urartu]|uniref:peroxidase n=1 Tax=Triticum urartu TaxID=4572 RepID=M7ZUS8_TRIUA|nr:Peroxidase 3 [Triticum urartu]